MNLVKNTEKIIFTIEKNQKIPQVSFQMQRQGQMRGGRCPRRWWGPLCGQSGASPASEAQGTFGTGPRRSARPRRQKLSELGTCGTFYF